MRENDIMGTDVPYTNREIKEKWIDISNSLSRIEIQTTTTNGKVADLNRWRERINGGASVAGFFMMCIILPILGWAIYVLVNIQDTIHKSINDTLQAYDLTIKP